MFKNLKDKYYFSDLSFVIYAISRFFVRLFFRLKTKVSVEYIGSKPDKSTNYLIVSNHKSLNDPPIIASFLDLPTAFIAKKELFTNPFLSFLISLYSAILLDRESAKKSTFDLTKKALRKKCFGEAWSSSIFIEGTRSKDPKKLGQPNNGPIFIARVNKVPILPVGISYNEKGQISIKVGEAYTIDRNKDMDDLAWDCLEKISKLCNYILPEKKA